MYCVSTKGCVVLPVAIYTMFYKFPSIFVVHVAVSCLQSALHRDVVVEIKPVVRETAVVRCLVTKVCVNELSLCEMWAAHGYKFVYRYIGSDISVIYTHNGSLLCYILKWSTVWKDAAWCSETSLSIRPQNLWPSAAVIWQLYVCVLNTQCTGRVSGRTFWEELWCLLSLLCDWNCARSLYCEQYVSIWTAHV
jgi:hypothetical protein